MHRSAPRPPAWILIIAAPLLGGCFRYVTIPRPGVDGPRVQRGAPEITVEDARGSQQRGDRVVGNEGSGILWVTYGELRLRPGVTAFVRDLMAQAYQAGVREAGPAGNGAIAPRLHVMVRRFRCDGYMNTHAVIDLSVQAFHPRTRAALGRFYVTTDQRSEWGVGCERLYGAAARELVLQAARALAPVATSSEMLRLNYPGP